MKLAQFMGKRILVKLRDIQLRYIFNIDTVRKSGHAIVCIMCIQKNENVFTLIFKA